MNPKHWAIHKHTEFKIFTTPSELREIADKMEEWWPRRKLGESTTVHTYFGEKMCIDICADQAKMEGE